MQHQFLEATRSYFLRLVLGMLPQSSRFGARAGWQKPCAAAWAPPCS